MSHILPRFYRSQQARIDRQAVDKAVAESIPLETQQVARSTPYGDRRRLRGIALVGRRIRLRDHCWLSLTDSLAIPKRASLLW